MALAFMMGRGPGTNFGGDSCRCEVEAPYQGAVNGDSLLVHHCNRDDGPPLGSAHGRRRSSTPGAVGKGLAEFHLGVTGEVLDPRWRRGNFSISPIEGQVVVRRASVDAERRRRPDGLVMLINRLHPAHPLPRAPVTLDQDRS